MRNCLLCFILFLLPILAFPAAPGSGKYKPKKRSSSYPGSPYLAIQGGYGIWSHSLQQGMQAYSPPVLVQLEYGNGRGLFSYVAGASLLTAFNQDIFVLKPNFAYAGLKYSWDKNPNLPKWLIPYVSAGLAGWQAILTDENYDGIINYQHKVETDFGLAGFIGAGVNVHLGSFFAGPSIMVFSGQNGSYLAGTFEKQPINPGHYVLSLNLGYRISFGRKNQIQCPAYK